MRVTLHRALKALAAFIGVIRLKTDDLINAFSAGRTCPVAV